MTHFAGHVLYSRRSCVSPWGLLMAVWGSLGCLCWFCQSLVRLPSGLSTAVRGGGPLDALPVPEEVLGNMHVCCCCPAAASTQGLAGEAFSALPWWLFMSTASPTT
jgi:hypothetical protein